MDAPEASTQPRAAPAASERPTGAPVARLHWGCGDRAAPGWVNSDRRRLPGVDLCGDIRDGLDVPDGRFDYAVSIHALQMVQHLELVPVLHRRAAAWYRQAVDIESAIGHAMVGGAFEGAAQMIS